MRRRGPRCGAKDTQGFIGGGVVCDTGYDGAGSNARWAGMSRREPGELEHDVLAVIGPVSHPMSVGEVQRRLAGNPAYTTVMTTLSRLAEKGALVREREGRGYVYTLAAPIDAVDDAVTARRMRRLLSDRSDRSAVLARFVAELDPEEERALAALLKRGSKGSSSP